MATTARNARHTAMQRLLHRHGIKQAALARACLVAPGTLSKAVALGQWPITGATALQDKLRSELLAHGCAPTDFERAFKALQKKSAPHTPTKARAGRTPSNPQAEGAIPMLLRRRSISPAARKQFNITRDPFTDEIAGPEDVFLSPDIRYVRESMWTTAKHGGFLAVVGESGSGKSTLRRDLIDRAHREGTPLIICEPYVLAMEDVDTKGKTLRSTHIAESIVSVVAPTERAKSSPEARFQQLHKLLKASHRSGNRHLLLIEEAHCMPKSTLKHLKRFLELEDGFRKLVSIILIAQPELLQKINETDNEVREVTQRLEIVQLPALDNHLADYLRFKFERVGLKLDQVFDDSAIEALRAKLTVTDSANKRRYSNGESTSLLHPLAIANVVAAALNSAAGIGAPRVSADLIAEV